MSEDKKKSNYTDRQFFFYVFVTLLLKNTSGAVLHNPWTISAGPTYASYKFNVAEHLSAISPYFESNSEGISPDPPSGCIIDKVIYQLRHGSIYANEYDYLHTIQPFLERLQQSFDKTDFSKSNDLAFLRYWKTPISNIEEQVAKVSKFGFHEAFSLGTRLAYRYPNLLPVNRDDPFKIWVSDSNRTRQSAEAVFSGLYAGHAKLGRIVTISENKDRGADTLTPTRSCPKFDVTIGAKQAEIWLNYYTKPIIARFTSMIPRFEFFTTDILAMQELCGYETIIRGSSPFCGIFSPDEWLSFEYYFDIKYFYELGYGNDLSASLGMPWVISSSKILTHKAVNDQRLYISIAHRQLPPLILTALGLFNDSEQTGLSKTDFVLPLNRIRYQREWKTSNFMSFLGQIALERLECQSAAYNGSFVRILVNSAPKLLPECTSGPGFSCPLEQYEAYVDKRSDLFEEFPKACGINKKDTPSKLHFFMENVV